ncbi:MAG: AMP-binding protein [Puniceicoccales bacterium]|jgi:acyl-CoA synthetase (AMP-forming)/AMP-acid ligase II|nr:AMP-binding protein [Puniceicoccales bacterium]
MCSKTSTANVARHLRVAALANPDFCAVRVPDGNAPDGSIRYIERSFAGLDRESDAAAALFARRGIGAGTRTLLLARPGLDLILSMFALLKLGAVPIAIDPGMGVRAFLRCVRNTRPEALTGTTAALALTRFFPWTFRSVHTRVRIGTAGFEAALRSEAAALPASGRPLFEAAGDTPAAILFTSGSTGAPKGVRYTHGMLDAQLALVRDNYGICPGEVDLPMLPVFALFNPALGTTTVTPEMDPSRPASADPVKIIRAIVQNQVTYSFGSPALWAKIARHCEPAALTLPSLRRVLIAGAPVPIRLLRSLRTLLPNAEIHTPYGATEVLPVASISGTEVLDSTWRETLLGRGTCVGKPLSGVRVAIIPVNDGPIASLEDAGQCAMDEVGEIIVQSASCTLEYDNNPEATKLAKIRDATGAVWHRMGDLGRLDGHGRLWFYGRKAERVMTPGGPLYTESCEAVFNAHPRVFRTALIGLGAPGAQEPALIVEPLPDALPRHAGERARFEAELLELGNAVPVTRGIQRFFFEKKFPVDVRHNAKIHRLTLRRKYERALHIFIA